jgi:glutamate racemase
MNNASIGVFDSGVGGISILKALQNKMPNEQFVYLADSYNAPYGPKDRASIIELCINNTEWLLSKGAKLIVVACNTATTNAIESLRNQYSCPFIGIEPAIKPAALSTKSGVVGVLATEGTLSSSLFYNTASMHTQNTQVIEKIGKGLVPLIEKGITSGLEIEKLLKQYIDPMLDAQIDTLVLGCTHYSFLIPSLKKILPNSIQIIDGRDAVARQTQFILNKYNLSASPEQQKSTAYFTTGKTKELKKFIPENESIEKVSITP